MGENVQLWEKKPELSFQASLCCWDSVLSHPAKFKSLGLISATLNTIKSGATKWSSFAMWITRLAASRHWLCFKIELYGPKPGYLRQFLSLRVRVQHW